MNNRLRREGNLAVDTAPHLELHGGQKGFSIIYSELYSIGIK